MLNPRLYSDLCAAALSRDYHRTVTLHQRVMDLTTRIYHQGFYSMPINRNIKCALSLMGICADFVCEPFQRCDKRERKILEKELIGLGLLRRT
jgi:4-hydroxy-tetrahydrodipicolinate synthase